MGTQQILLLVLSVIIVGVSVSVGITMFANQAYNANQQGVASELQNYGMLSIQYYKTPKSQGGAGMDSTAVTVAKIAPFLGFTGPNDSVTSDNGEFRIISITGAILTLKGKGVEMKNDKFPLVTTTVGMATGTVISSVSSGTTF